MSRLADDCFAYGGERIAVRAAHELLRQRTAPVVGTEQVDLAAASGRSLASPLCAPRDVPAFDNAAVDGYAFAFRPGMAESGATLARAEGRAAAGHPFAGPLVAGAAVRILTGASMPKGTDTVALQEEVKVEGDVVRVPPGLKPGANRRRAGEDVAAGARLLEAGTLLRPQEIREQFRHTFSTEQLARDAAAVATQLRQWSIQAKQVFLDFDCDVLEPAFFPAVARPVPFGVSPMLLLQLVDAVWSERVCGVAISEFVPNRDRNDESLVILTWLLEYLLLRRYEPAE